MSATNFYTLHTARPVPKIYIAKQNSLSQK